MQMAPVTPASSAKDSEAVASLEAASNPIIAGILGPNTDGRVRNPVPSKLKGKTNKKQGNFGVMHMGVTPAKKTDAAAERDAAARRTSENTAQRAKAAQTDKYVPPKRRGLDAMAKEEMSVNRASVFGGKDESSKRSRPLAPDETKYEQARLLTLLRSINPITVVDQICKAVAYFGGIPGAPPPEDGIFPESANTKETGALFIGWLAEIFPDLARQAEVLPEARLNGAKKNGRPGQTKGSPYPTDRFSLHAPPNSANGYGYGPAVNPPSWGLPPSLIPSATPLAPPTFLPDPTPAPPIIPQETPIMQQASPAARRSPDAPAPKEVLEEFLAGASSVSRRKRGRPKGSRNKGKSEGQTVDSSGPISVQTKEQGQVTGQIQSTGQSQVIIQDQSTEQEVQSSRLHQDRAQQPPKDASSVPPASTASAQVLNTQPEQQHKHHVVQTSVNDNTIPTSAQDDILSPEERAVLEAFRPQNPGIINSTALSAEASQLKKRKRIPPHPKPAAASREGAVSEGAQLTQGSKPVSEQSSAALTQDALHWSPAKQKTPTLPPAKRPRQRKPKLSTSAEAPSLINATSVISNNTQATVASTIPDSMTGSSQQSMPVPTDRPPAEGLEAHFERFANFQPQNGRSNTPNVTSQQQMRQQHQNQHHQQQQQRIVSAPTNTSQPHQHQMQQQQSQQGIQRDEPKMSQASVLGPSSTTGLYNQQSSSRTSYSQQYPSHQPSKASYATHQASPQMSNAGYRSAASLTQASSAISQIESNYRTASPNIISQPQPSPSFSTSDTSNYRTNHNHGLTQPSPTYSQAGSAYGRTGSSSSIAHTQSQTQSSAPYPSGRTLTQSQSLQQPSHQPSQQAHYSTFADSSYIDLPTLESLGHNASNATSNTISASVYAQQHSLGVSRAGSASNGLYVTNSAASMNSVYDMGSPAVSRPTLGTTSNLAAAFNGVENQREIREQMMRAYKR